MYDVEKVRGDFPILSTRINGRPLVYLDNAATSQKPRSVIRAISDYYERSNSNVHRGVHTLSMMASEAYEEARAKVQRFVGAPGPESIVWTRNATESINLVAASWGLSNLREGDEIVATGMEHHSNLVPWQQLAERTGATLKFISVQGDGTLDMESAGEAITERTRLVAVTHLSNVLGTVNPVKDLAARAHGVGAVILVDGAQSVPHMPVDVTDLDCDFLAFSAHKMLGPTGVGVLYGRPELLDAMPPYMFGGDMILRVTYEDARWNQVPYKFEAGTPNIAGAVGTGAAVDYLTALGMESVWAHEQRLTAYALERMRELELVTVMGPQDPAGRGGTISFSHEWIHPHDLGTVLDSMGIAIRTGHHCAMPLVRSYGLTASARASFYVYNNEEEIDLLIDGLKEAERYFTK